MYNFLLQKKKSGHTLRRWEHSFVTFFYSLTSCNGILRICPIFLRKYIHFIFKTTTYIFFVFAIIDCKNNSCEIVEYVYKKNVDSIISIKCCLTRHWWREFAVLLIGEWGAQNVSKSDLKRLHSVHSYRHESNLNFFSLSFCYCCCRFLSFFSQSMLICRYWCCCFFLFFGLRAHLVTAAAN